LHQACARFYSKAIKFESKSFALDDTFDIHISAKRNLAFQMKEIASAGHVW
jgi:hypothetical protein